ncbi:aromatic ring-hydroxylating oxygenase subunit alpha [Pontixanthobacter aquaemixtae]|uniref:Rieske 2Fe-2S domain-containing protein n=1 Tax=Pontixanthobacter aquaemixtae TaxID=1958940 RepID=A0A844ZSK8_9SPHN|nr:aromatic ring-hydroxylating dioxygenase subunit alpha [Pontixanthobacter aquaemixtae]MXO89986.1 Rieske 2Fe-2S domain-containing protein [Pontixanthobacter aquaemixtae]
MNAESKAFEQVSQERVAFLGTRPIPAKPYYDADWFELEREAVFRRSWMCVGHICEVPEKGSFIRRELEVLKASLLIVRGKDEKLRAFHNVCTHRGTQLVEEAQGKRTRFSCPYHMWTFGSDGELVSAPDFEQFHVAKEDCALKQVALEVIAGLIFVNFSKEPEALSDQLGDLVTQMESLPVARATTFSEYVYEIDANWKLTYDNFQENYHLRFIHPRSGGAACGKDNPFGYPAEVDFHGDHRTQTIWSNPDASAPAVQELGFGRTIPAAMEKGLLNTDAGRKYFALFPSFFMFGTPVQNFVHVVYPISAEKSRGVIRLYWVDEDGSASERFGREAIMVTAHDVHCEDTAVIEAGQRGISSGALEHIHMQTQESLCRHLFNVVEEKVHAYQAERNGS